MPAREEIGEQLKAMRLAQGLTLREAASRCGVSFQMLGQIEKGQNTTIDRIEAIIEGLGGGASLAVSEASEPLPESRRAIAARFLKILPNIPDEELDVFIHELALWERRYESGNSFK